MAKTTIPVEARTRDRIWAHGLAGMTYDQIINRVLDATDRETFLAAQRDKILRPDAYRGVDLDDLWTGLSSRTAGPGGPTSQATDDYIYVHLHIRVRGP